MSQERGTVAGAYLLCNGEVPEIKMNDILEVVGVDDAYVIVKAVDIERKGCMVMAMLMTIAFGLMMIMMAMMQKYW